MADYIALLGRINVGGNTVTMADLRSIVAELGHTGVGTYIQTGNVFFDSPETDTDLLARQLGAHLTERLGFSVPTFVRSTAELARVLADDPFAGVDVDADTRLMVVALDRELPANTDFPVIDEAKGFTVLGVRGREALIVLRLIKGRPGNVVVWLEKRFDVKGTGRFAHTLEKIVAAAS